jgi:predicted HAD superfamily Cof-like phosphohydrolase
MSDAIKVKEFTESSNGITCPDRPTLMSRDSVKFIIRMIISELDELACTVSDNEDMKDALMQECLTTRDKCFKFKNENLTEEELIADQYDALVDSYYYSLNISAKHGANLSKIFNRVHEANMAKRDPVTGKFIRRESDGKVMKPLNWQAPDITAEVKDQILNGSWS